MSCAMLLNRESAWSARAVTRGQIPLVRPSAYFWSRFQFVGALALLASIVLVVVLIIGFHLFWASVVPAAFAFGSQAGNIGGLVQGTRELRRGYTTQPWLAY